MGFKVRKRDLWRRRVDEIYRHNVEILEANVDPVDRGASAYQVEMRLAIMQANKELCAKWTLQFYPGEGLVCIDE